MKKSIAAVIILFISEYIVFPQNNTQVFYDFGSENTKCQNQRTNRVTTTVEGLHFDRFGNTFYFVDFDYSINSNDPKQAIFGGYWEISRTLNFWSSSKAKDISLHVEYNGGLGIYNGGGYAISHVALVGVDYFLHTSDYQNTFNLKLLYKYNTAYPKTTVPLQLTFVWNCKNIGKVKGLDLCGYADFYEQADYFALTTEPQIWYNVGQWFKCPMVDVGTEIEVSYNFTGQGWMVNPCLGLRWRF